MFRVVLINKITKTFRLEMESQLAHEELESMNKARELNVVGL